MTHLSETDQLAELLDRKHGTLVQLRSLGVQQRRLIASGDMSELMALLAAKQTLIGELQAVERQLDPFREQDPDTRDWPSPQRRAEVAALNDQANALLAEVLLQERESEHELQLRRDEAAQRLQGMHSASAARGAYTADNRPSLGQIDLTTEA